jgi:hypothetical protein
LFCSELVFYILFEPSKVALVYEGDQVYAIDLAASGWHLAECCTGDKLTAKQLSRHTKPFPIVSRLAFEPVAYDRIFALGTPLTDLHPALIELTEIAGGSLLCHGMTPALRKAIFNDVKAKLAGRLSLRAPPEGHECWGVRAAVKTGANGR